jgi:hypothetical protein
VGLLGVSKVMTSGGKSSGYCNAAVVFDKDLPVACFGVSKQPTDKGQYLYLLLFKNPADKITGAGVSGKTSSSGNSVDESFQVTLGKKVVEIACKFTTDEKTHALTSETITVGTTPIKKDGTRVFLVDLSQDKVTYRPVKVTLPDEVPDLKDTTKKTWAKAVLRAVEQLKKKSPAAKKFLD